MIDAAPASQHVLIPEKEWHAPLTTSAGTRDTAMSRLLQLSVTRFCVKPFLNRIA